jgi:ribose transport system substrate-binding protein
MQSRIMVQSRLTVSTIALVAMAVAGCSSSKHTAASATTSAPAAAPATTSATATSAAPAASPAAAGAPTKPSKSYKITLIKGVNGDPFYATMACGVQAEATKLGATVNVVGGDKWGADVQTPVVNSVTAQHPDAVLIAPNDTKAMLAPLQQLTAAGIKLVIVDTGLDDESGAVAVISSDNAGGGKLAADELGDEVGGKGSVFVMNVQAGISTTDARAKGFIDEIKAKYPSITVLDTQYNDDDPAKAASITTSVLSAHPDLAGVFATNVQGAEGTATGLKQASKQGAVKVIGYDAGPQQVQDLQNGIVQGLIAQDPYTEGVDSVEQAVAALSGQTVTRTIQTTLAALTTSNLTAKAQYVYKNSCS